MSFFNVKYFVLSIFVNFLFFDSFMYVYSQGQFFRNLVALSHSLLSLAEIFLLNYFFPTSHVACVMPWVEQGLPAKWEVIFRNIIKLLGFIIEENNTPSLHLPFTVNSLMNRDEVSLNL